jgi:hypothetical protein
MQLTEERRDPSHAIDGGAARLRDPDTVELENIAADLPTSALADAIAGRKKLSTRRMLRCEPHNVKGDTVFDLLPERCCLGR